MNNLHQTYLLNHAIANQMIRINTRFSGQERRDAEAKIKGYEQRLAELQ